MKKVLDILQKIENFTLAFAFSIMVLACFVQVVNRNTLQIPFTGFEEMAKYSMVYMVFLGTELGLRDGTQISVTAVVDKLHGKAKKALLLLSKVIVIGFSGIMFNCATQMVTKQLAIGQLSPGLQIPMAFPYFALVLGFGLIVIVQCALLVQAIMNFNKPEVTEQAVEGVEA